MVRLSSVCALVAVALVGFRPRSDEARPVRRAFRVNKLETRPRFRCGRNRDLGERFGAASNPGGEYYKAPDGNQPCSS